MDFYFTDSGARKVYFKNEVVIIPDQMEMSVPVIFVIYADWYFINSRSPFTALLCPTISGGILQFLVWPLQ